MISHSVRQFFLPCLRKNWTLFFISFQIQWDMIVETVFLSIFWTKWNSICVQNRKENCHHDYIPFNLKGNEILVFSVCTIVYSPYTSTKITCPVISVTLIRLEVVSVCALVWVVHKIVLVNIKMNKSMWYGLDRHTFSITSNRITRWLQIWIVTQFTVIFLCDIPAKRVDAVDFHDNSSHFQRYQV